MSTPSANRRSSPRGRPGPPRTRLACSVGRSTMLTPATGRHGLPARCAAKRRSRRPRAARQHQKPCVPGEPARRGRRCRRPRRPCCPAGSGAGSSRRSTSAGSRRSTRPCRGPAGRAGVSPNERRREHVVHDVAGIVVVHGDLFEDHAALGLDVSRGDQRRGDHVADHVDRERQVGVEHPRVVAGVLLGREGVHLAADRVHDRGDLERAAPLGALEQQVLEVVRGPREPRRLVPRADADPDAERDRAHGRDLLADHPQAAGQDGPADHRGVSLGGQRAGAALDQCRGSAGPARGRHTRRRHRAGRS